MSEHDDDTVRLDLAALVDPDPTAYVERWRPPVPPNPNRCTPCLGRAHEECTGGRCGCRH